MNCPRCGKSTPFSTGSFCSHCGTLLDDTQTPSVDISNSAKDAFFTPEVPWESELLREAPLKALAATFTAIIFHPSRFYLAAVSPKTTALFPALWYGLITGSVGIVGSWLWSLVYDRYDQFFGNYPILFGTMSISSSTLITTPLLLLFQYFIIAWYTRLSLHFFKCRKASTAEVIRILCYAESTSVLMFIPVAGYALSLVTGIYSILTGFRALFGISRRKIFFALIVPIAVLTAVLLFFIIGGIVGGTIAGAGFLQHVLPHFQ